MPRPPKLRKKRVGKHRYWVTSSGGGTANFGNVADVSYDDARRKFAEYVKSLSDGSQPSNDFAVADLINKFLGWIKDHRSHRTYDQRRRDCNRFGNDKVKRKRLADIRATQICGADLEAWLASCRRKGEQLYASPSGNLDQTPLELGHKASFPDTVSAGDVPSLRRCGTCLCTASLGRHVRCQIVSSW